MTRTEKLAASLIEDVLEAVARLNPEIEVPENSSLIRGVAYYNLESSIAEKLEDYCNENYDPR
jgi:hypothetical protein